MNTFSLTISSPGGNIFKGEAVKLSLRGIEGDLAVMAGHIPFATAVKAGTCRVELPDGSERAADIGGGLLTVTKTGTILLSGSFEWK